MIGLIKPLQQLRNRTPLGWLQLSHDKGRMAVAVAGIAFADVLMFMQLGFQNALYSSNTRLHQTLQTDLVLMNPQGRNLLNLSSFPRRRLYQAMNVHGVKSADPLYVKIANWKNPETRQETSIMVLGFNPDRPAFDLPEVNKNLNLIKLPDTVLFDRASRGDYQGSIAQINQGQSVKTEIDRRTIAIGGLFTVGASFAADGALITSDQNYLRLFPRQDSASVNAGLIQLQPGADSLQVQQVLKAYLPSDVKVLTKQEFIELEKNYWAKNTAIGFVFNLGVAMGFVVGVIIVYQVLSTDVSDHMAEYATFKAMGYRNIYLLGIVFEEAIILSVLGFLPGVGVSVALYHVTRQATNLPLYMTIGRALAVLILNMVMCSISGAIATRKLQAADPADIF
ncbi:MAG: FtsX-like permease family protein [Microcoleus sp. PH2017_10_PVI_O_A]|uniref:ABC transporter permease DevC n=1 Tax=unclassified Microcoleus TaxID=2642155 RepID=UPI001E03615F|nr:MULTISPECIES: ABC transporter permease DevC [unclassified Microcoleus]TAE85981.1 MAG: FtsX-like permease family protein [Oscillatoriales cyanobacterium]MCC3404018.1 FtsX-like permease family protein [Microcoleus sp. PH2017_10_PVI_O_A]MCC3458101.1 FtsX-like permease family protein [Microcoleus sp. PH2017_11_PCY_U_A]MCC3476523.1 FtsX-like permease family protein [Microcoleus sp. PH2017_12_PCY_D_A]MCC3557651.1 FtsX-like permease family protein [Microcoleus sp. PH2017_27_LUM_O_A]